MKSIALFTIVLFTFSCGTENHYFKKSISDADKTYLNDHDTLIKEFSGKTNWYRQYWTGKLSIKKNNKGYEIKQVGEWRQTSDDGSEIWTVATFDDTGYLIDQEILGDEGMPPISQIHCKKDTVAGEIHLVCELIKRFHNGQLKERGKWVIVGDNGTKEGKWDYYTDSGVLEKTVEYLNDKPVR